MITNIMNVIIKITIVIIISIMIVNSYYKYNHNDKSHNNFVYIIVKMIELLMADNLPQ